MRDKLKPGLLVGLLAGLLAAGVIAAVVVVASDGDDHDVETVELGALAQEDAVPDQDDVVPEADDVVPDADDATPDADDVPVGDADLKRASQAAVDAVGGGEAVSVERSDDPGEAYEVEVLWKGVDHDVALDEQFKPVRNAAYQD
jgi:hypothetical protein